MGQAAGRNAGWKSPAEHPKLAFSVWKSSHLRYGPQSPLMLFHFPCYPITTQSKVGA